MIRFCSWVARRESQHDPDIRETRRSFFCARSMHMLWFCVVWLPFLPRQEIKKPAPDETPKWTECMSLYDGAAVAATYVYQRMLPLENVPRWRLNQCPRENTHEACVSLGCIKQKSVDMKWWKAGVQQIILWAGTARTGRAAKGRYNAKQSEAQRQAVGRWQAGAKRNFQARSSGRQVVPRQYSSSARAAGAPATKEPQHMSGNRSPRSLSTGRVSPTKALSRRKRHASTSSS